MSKPFDFTSEVRGEGVEDEAVGMVEDRSREARCCCALWISLSLFRALFSRGECGGEEMLKPEFFSSAPYQIKMGSKTQKYTSLGLGFGIGFSFSMVWSPTLEKDEEYVEGSTNE
jgi:hypothetical protein